MHLNINRFEIEIVSVKFLVAVSGCSFFKRVYFFLRKKQIYLKEINVIKRNVQHSETYIFILVIGVIPNFSVSVQ